MRSRGPLFAAAMLIAIAMLYFGSVDSSHAPVQTSAPTRVAAEPPAIPPEYMPAPFGERRIEFLAMGEAPPSQTARFCDDANWDQIDLLVSRSEDGAFRVDEDTWNRKLTGTKVGLASWMSQCQRDGDPVEIVAADSGTLLATYDPRTGLRSHR